MKCSCQPSRCNGLQLGDLLLRAGPFDFAAYFPHNPEKRMHNSRDHCCGLLSFFAPSMAFSVCWGKQNRTEKKTVDQKCGLGG